MKNKYFNRELSWLSFNHRVLQEAMDDSVPLIERLRFLAIFSSNLDEFFRVRVASYKHLLRIQKAEHLNKKKSVKKLIRNIKKIVDEQQREFGRIFHEVLIPALRSKNVCLVDQQDLEPEHTAYLLEYFDNEVAKWLDLRPMSGEPVFLENKGVYLVVQMSGRKNGGADEPSHYLLNLPHEKTDRFITVPDTDGRHVVIQLQDVIRMFLDRMIPSGKVESCYAIKLTRDAQLYLEDEVAGAILDKIKASLYKRKVGSPTRLLYDESMPKSLRNFIQKSFGVERDDMIAGGRYHNFNEFFGFPMPDEPDLVYPPFPSLQHRELEGAQSILDEIRQRDHILHFPYQSYDYVVRMLDESAEDPQVKTIKITLYRVSGKSAVCRALIRAAQNGKQVFVFNEVKARFDEESNIYWGEQMEAAGIEVRYGYEEIKVHSKVCLIYRNEEEGMNRYAYFGTGNFNEKTARIYGDHALLTSDERLTSELERVFHYLETDEQPENFDHLLVAPFNMRERFCTLVDREIEYAQNGNRAEMTLKMNSLEDRGMIDKLYEASRAGVRIQMIIRGICCLVPGVRGMSEHIKVTSIVDRYLEHARVYWFHNSGEDEMYLASADWMKRNLSRRVEVGFPIYDPQVKSEIQHMIDLQLKDNTKARHIDADQINEFVERPGENEVRAQFDTYRWLERVEIPVDEHEC